MSIYERGRSERQAAATRRWWTYLLSAAVTMLFVPSLAKNGGWAAVFPCIAIVLMSFRSGYLLYERRLNLERRTDRLPHQV